MGARRPGIRRLEGVAEGVEFKSADVESARGRRVADQLRVASIPAVFVKTDDAYVRVFAPTIPIIRAALRRHEEECDEFG
jgi:thioredoxin-like negative regulator of GroEL